MAGCSYAPHALVQGTTSLTFFDEAVRGAFETTAADCPSPPSVLPLPIQAWRLARHPVSSPATTPS